jgi:hypothetical protein
MTNIKKEEIEKITQIKGNVRGAVLGSNAVFIQSKEGREGVKALEEKMAELGHPLNFDEIKPGEWYPESLSVLSILIAKDLFNWDEKDVFNMGNFAPKFSFIPKVIMKYFLSLKKFLREVPNYWKQHFDFGELESSELNEEKKYLVLREKGYKFHPLMCLYHAGYYLRIAYSSIKSEKITIEETKCIFKGDSYHEYVVKWE